MLSDAVAIYALTDAGEGTALATSRWAAILDMPSAGRVITDACCGSVSFGSIGRDDVLGREGSLTDVRFVTLDDEALFLLSP